MAGLLILLTLLLTGANAALPKPAVPEFTVNLYDSSYDIPATSRTDPFTGQTVTTPGRHVEARTVEIRIKNPYFSPESNIYPIEFRYDIHYRGHFNQDDSWYNVFDTRDGYLKPSSTQAETVYKVVGIPGGLNEIDMLNWSRYIPVNAIIDFQVRAFIGGYTGTPFTGWTFIGETSDWSSTQTITLDFNTPVPRYVPPPADAYGTIAYAYPLPTPSNSPSPQSTQAATQPSIPSTAAPTATDDTATPTQPSNTGDFMELLDWKIAVAVLAVIVIVIALTVFALKKR
jgi:hypothetical protein